MPANHALETNWRQTLDLRCVLLSDPNTYRCCGVPTKTRLTSSIKISTPRFMYDWISRCITDSSAAQVRHYCGQFPLPVGTACTVSDGKQGTCVQTLSRNVLRLTCQAKPTTTTAKPSTTTTTTPKPTTTALVIKPCIASYQFEPSSPHYCSPPIGDGCTVGICVQGLCYATAQILKPPQCVRRIITTQAPTLPATVKRTTTTARPTQFPVVPIGSSQRAFQVQCTLEFSGATWQELLTKGAYARQITQGVSDLVDAATGGSEDEVASSVYLLHASPGSTTPASVSKPHIVTLLPCLKTAPTIVF